MPMNHARALKVLSLALLLAAQVVGAASRTLPQKATETQAMQGINPELLVRRWDAMWIVAPGTDPFGFGVYHFRKAIELPTRPRRFVVHVTADNRY